MGTALAFILSPLGKLLGGAAIILFVLGYAYNAGYQSSAAKCDAAALRAQIATLQADLDNARKAELRAIDQAQSAAVRAHQIDERLQSYEQSLGETPPACLLSDRDASRLRDLTK